MKKTRQTLATTPHHAHMRHAARTTAKPAREPLYSVRRSRIHGSGVYAARRIRKGTRIVEYLGERISHAQADARYEAKGQDDGHTFLFVVDGRVVIDAGVNGNDARFINHSCDPNCETVIEDRRVFIEAVRTIEPGEELGYEYGLTWESTDDPDELANYACRCGAAKCRGTMLDEEPLDLKQARKAARKKARRKASQEAGRKVGKTASRSAGKTAKRKAKAPPAGAASAATKKADRAVRSRASKRPGGSARKTLRK